jgi:Ca2+-binding RTX toxin-like protein
MRSLQKLWSRKGAATALVVLAALATVLGVASAGAEDAACTGGQTTSADGTVIYGDACAETIVATSPEVEEIYAGGGDDVIYANPDIEVVAGGAGEDVIYGELPDVEAEGVPYFAEEGALARRRSRAGGSGPIAGASLTPMPCAEKTAEGKSCYGGIGNQELQGGTGNDKIFGQRGNDVLLGEAGSDSLYAGIGDDTVKGGPGADLVSGGYGKDLVDGEENADLVRGDGTTDTINDTGATGTDTLSYATASSPGFHGEPGIANFPPDTDSEERGVEVHLDGSTACEGIGSAAGIVYQGCNNASRYGGGSDKVEGNKFENLIGSAFADVLVGSGNANQIFGGGGTDVIKGGEGNDTLYGGAEGDYLDGGGGVNTLEGGSGTNNCFNNGGGSSPNCVATPSASVQPRNRKLISVGFMSTTFPANPQWSELYLVGSEGADAVTARYSVVESVPRVTFTATAGAFSTEGSATTANCTYGATSVVCTLPRALDTIVLAGMKGGDTLSIENFLETATPVLLGGEDGDTLRGSSTEDVVVDGNATGNDTLLGKAADDALVNNEGADRLEGGDGNDLLVSLGTCEGDTLQGAESENPDEEADNNASWAPAPQGAGTGGVTADLAEKQEVAGNTYGTVPGCEVAGTVLDQLRNIDDVEGSAFKDVIYGQSDDNSLFGRDGEDRLFSRGGEDFIDAIDPNTAKHDEVNAGGSETDWCEFDSKDTTAFCDD